VKTRRHPQNHTYISHRRRRRTEPRTQVTCTEKLQFVKFGCVVY